MHDFCVDIVDYCHRQLVAQLAQGGDGVDCDQAKKKLVEEEESENESDEETEERKKILKVLSCDGQGIQTQ